MFLASRTILHRCRNIHFRPVLQALSTPSICEKPSVCLCTSPPQHQEKLTGLSAEKYNNVNFTRLYRFPYIQSVRLLARLKLYQTVGSVALTQVYGVLYCMEKVSSHDVTVALGVTGFAGLMMYIMSGYFNNLIGILSLSEDQKMLRVGHLTFWGGRRNLLVPVDQVVPLSDLPDANRLNDIFIKFKRYDTDKELLISLRFGGIDDIEKFKKVFEPSQNLE